MDTTSHSIKENILYILKIIIGFILILILPVMLTNILNQHFSQTNFNIIWKSTLTILFTIGLYIGYLKLWNKNQTFPELATKNFWKYALSGAMIAFVYMSLTIGFIALLAEYKIIKINSWTGLIPAVIGSAVAGVSEELAFRGIFFRLIEARLGTTIGLVLSAILFGAIHLGNPGATIQSALAITLEAGVMLALAFVVTRNLWFPIFIHTFWNWSEGPFYGTEVSGTTQAYTFMDSQISGNPAITGGSFGPEAGVPAIILGLILGGIFFYIAKKTNRWIYR